MGVWSSYLCCILIEVRLNREYYGESARDRGIAWKDWKSGKCRWGTISRNSGEIQPSWSVQVLHDKAELLLERKPIFKKEWKGLSNMMKFVQTMYVWLYETHIPMGKGKAMSPSFGLVEIVVRYAWPQSTEKLIHTPSTIAMNFAWLVKRKSR